MAGSVFVEFSAVSKQFGAAPPVLERISFAAHSGDFVGLIGPSGSGKSTLLRLIAGLSPVTRGALTIGGRTPDQAAAELAFVFQEPTLLPWLTVAQNIEAPLKLRHLPAAQRRAIRERVLEQVRLPEKSAAYPRQLSGGQKMRVSIARALALSPKLLLLDEPFGALDEITREQLNEELLALREQQAWTAFFVTHSVAEAVFLSNRILVLATSPGRIAAEVPVDLPYPRTAETRLSRTYQDLVTAVSRLVRRTDLSAPAA
jgi:NitT/TauT family transport system ATP-binding protein